MSRIELIWSGLTRWGALVLLGAVPLIVWPGVDRPFSAPKLWLLTAGSVFLLALAGASRSLGRAVAATPLAIRWAVLAWTASFAWSGMLAPHVLLESLVLGLAGPAWWLALVASGATAAQIVAVQAIAAGVVASVTLAQWFNHDPFVMAGWVPAIAGGSSRLRMYGTLGNPNFVAAWLAITAPAILALTLQLAANRRRGLAMATAGSLVLTVVAIAGSGSRGGALGLAAGLAGLAVYGRARLSRSLVVAALAVLVALPWVSTGRPLRETLAGRLHIWRVTVPHALDRSFTGWGPGAFELVYYGWQGSTHFEGGTGGGFAGPQQRAHNDYLEALVERGLPGLAATCLLFGAGLLTAYRQSRRVGWNGPVAGAASSVMAAAAVATVDFPLARPAEIAALWCALAAVAVGVARWPDPARLKPVAPATLKTLEKKDPS